MPSDEIEIDFLCELLSCGLCGLKEHSCCPHFHKHTHTRRSRRHSVTPTDSPYPWKRSNADAGELVIDFGLEEMWHAVMGYWLNHRGCMDTQGCRAWKVNRVWLAFQRNLQKKQEAEKLSKQQEAMLLHHIPNMCNLQSWQQFCHVMAVFNYIL